MSAAESLQSLLDEGVREQVFPMARAVVVHQGRLAFDGGAGGAGPATVFDLASITKVMATTACFMSLWGERKIRLDERVASGVTVADLLYHRSGLPDFRPFFAEVMNAEPRLFDADCPREAREAARAEVVRLAAATPAERPPRQSAVYSDVGFILLGEVVAGVGGRPLDQLFEARVAGPFGLEARFGPVSTAAPTGTTRPREPAPGQQGMWKVPPRPGRPGEVDDDNAWAMGGVAGHAGLFGTAGDLARFGERVLGELRGEARIAPANLWRMAVLRDVSVPGSTRALGFDTPSAQESSAGTLLGRGSKGAVGHLGFTGVSLWIDLDRELVVALCTNRTLLGRANVRIRAFRPRFHDAVVKSLGLA